MALAYFSSFILFIILCSLSPLLVCSDSNDDYGVGILCIGNSTEGSNLYHTYESNVYSLLPKLASESAHSHRPAVGYLNATAGTAPDTAYGYYFCRGDLKTKVCHDCVSHVTQFALSRNHICFDAFGIGEINDHLHCFVHYGNSSAGYREQFVFTFGKIGGKVSNYKQYNETLTSTVEGLISEAAQGNLSKPGYQTKVVKVVGNPHEKIYTLVQCTPDISPRNCSNCLRELYSYLPDCCNGTQGGMVVHANCWLMYNNQTFFGSAYRGFLPSYLHVCLTLFLSFYLLLVS